MVGEHLRREEHGAAARLLAELDAPPPELLAKLDALTATLDARASELQRLSRDQDARFGQRTRWFGIALMGTCWSLSPAIVSRCPSLWVERPLGIAPIPAGLLLLAGALAYWARESLMGTRYNRTFVGVIFAALAAQLLMLVGADLAAWPLSALTQVQFFLWFVVTTLACICVEPRLWLPPLGYLASFLSLCAAPGSLEPADFIPRSLQLMSEAHFTLTLTALVVWRPRSLRRLPDEHLRGSG